MVLCRFISDAAIKIKVTQENLSNEDEKAPELILKRYQHCAYLVAETITNMPINTVWENESVLNLPNQSYLSFSQRLGDGFALKHLNNKQLCIKNRLCKIR